MKSSKTSLIRNAILFSILLLLATLVIFKIMEKQEKDVQKNKAIAALKTELTNNQYRLNSWIQLDDKTRMQLDSLVKKTRANENYEGRLPSGLLMNEKRSISADLSLFSFEETAWRAMKNSEVAKNLDYEFLRELEIVYGAQRLVVQAYAEIPEVKIASENDRKYSDADFRFLGKLRLTYSKLQLAESQLKISYDQIFGMQEFTSEEEE